MIVFTPMTTKTRKTRRQPWNSKYTDDMPERLYQLRSEGKTLVQAAKALGTTRKTLHMWSEDPDKPEFKEAYEASFEASQAWIENLVHDIITGEKDCKGAQKDLLQMKLRTHFREDWAEKKESTININDQTQQMSNDDLDDAIRRVLKLDPQLKLVGKNGSTKS